jgi:transcription factor S
LGEEVLKRVDCRIGKSKMEFCEKCGGIIVVKEGKVACAGCNYRPKKKPRIEVSEHIKKHDVVAVINEDFDNTHPIVQILCPKCKNKEAYFWTSQTRSSDESETKFYKCTEGKCKHTWRVYK